MDELDRKLIIELQNNPRQTNKYLATILNTNEVTISRRIEQLVASDTIRLTALPNLTMFGYHLRLFITLRTVNRAMEKIGEQLCKIDCVRFVSSCVGFADFYITADLESLDFLNIFITKHLGSIEGVNKIQTIIPYKDIKRTHSRLDSSGFINNVIGRNKKVSADEVDIHLILLLQKNARAPLKELASEIGVSEVTVHRRIIELVNSGFIVLTAIPNNAKIGYPARCFVFIETQLSKLNYVADFISQFPQVHYVGLISGQTQIMAGIRASSDEALSDFVTRVAGKIEGVLSIETLTFLKVLKNNYTWLN